MSVDSYKLAAARRALGFVEPRMRLGLGTGSTASVFVELLGAQVREGLSVLCVPTSEQTRALARSLDIPLSTLDETPLLDLTIDGADEIDPQLNLIKGLGGALLREMIVAAASRRLIIIADDSKRVEQLGTRVPVPVEVVVFARRPVADYLASLGARVVERRKDGERFITDEGNLILDCHFPGLPNPSEMAQLIRAQPGVVEHGLFLGMATEAIVAGERGILVLER